MGKTLREMSIEIRENCIVKGWRAPDGGPGHTTWGDYVGLLHTEIGEASEAFRRWGLRDATGAGLVTTVHESGAWGEKHYPAKPEGVGSELADGLIRDLDMCDAYAVKAFSMDLELADVSPYVPESGWPSTFIGTMAWLHGVAAELYPTTLDVPRYGTGHYAAKMLRAVVAVAEHYSVDLVFEYERKMAYNRTRPFRHGSKVV